MKNQAWLANIGLGWKDLPGANTLAYEEWGQGKLMALLSANFNVLSAFRRSPPAGNTLTSHWGGQLKHANVTLEWKAESGAERPLQKAESRAVNLPGPLKMFLNCLNGLFRRVNRRSLDVRQNERIAFLQTLVKWNFFEIVLGSDSQKSYNRHEDR